MKNEAVAVLHDIRSVENVGSMFRTADAAGIGCIFLTGITPTPIDRFGRCCAKISKSALGAEKKVPWKQETDIASLFSKFRDEGIEIIAVEQSPNALGYSRYSPKGAYALVVGNEVSGLPQEVLEQANVILEIPQSGSKESLNVAVAFGIVAFRLRDSN